MQGRQFFQTPAARKRAKSSSKSNDFYEIKAEAMRDESKRRQEWHEVNVAIKQAQLKVWQTIARTLEQNPGAMADVVPLLATMQSHVSIGSTSTASPPNIYSEMIPQDEVLLLTADENVYTNGRIEARDKTPDTNDSDRHEEN